MFCPQVSRLAHQMAVVSEHVVAEVVDVAALSELARKYHVTSVPKTLLNGSVELLGSQSEESFLDGIERARSGFGGAAG